MTFGPRQGPRVCIVDPEEATSISISKNLYLYLFLCLRMFLSLHLHIYIYQAMSMSTDRRERSAECTPAYSRPRTGIFMLLKP